MYEETERGINGWQLCRICTGESDTLIDIYDETGINMQLEDKINHYLPITVTVDDDLPLFICLSCIDKLNTTHELITLCIETNDGLSQLLKMKQKLAATDLHPASDTETQKQCVLIKLDSENETFKKTNEVMQTGSPHNKTALSFDSVNHATVCDEIKQFQKYDSISSIMTGTGKTCTQTGLRDVTFAKHEMKKNGLNTEFLTEITEEMHRSLDCLNGNSVRPDIDGEISIPQRHEMVKKFIAQAGGGIKITDTVTHMKQEVLCTTNYKLSVPGEIEPFNPSRIFISNKKPGLNENEVLESANNKLNEDESSIQVIESTCNICGFKYNLTELKNHICIKNVKDVALGHLPHKYCLKRLGGINMLNVPMQGDACIHCGQCFINQDSLRMHIMEHDDMKPWCCDYESCGKAFLHNSSMEIHQTIHRSDEPWLCDHCGKSFTHVSNLRVHKRSHLDDDSKKRHKCEVCGKAFRSRFLVRDHMRSHTGERPFLCDRCPKRFTTKERLKQHMAIHEGIRPFQCSICSFSSVRRGNLVKHSKTHIKNRFECKVCYAYFPNTVALFNHYHTHSEEEVKQSGGAENVDKARVAISGFQCSDCGKFLSSKASLNIHRRMHAGIRPFLCTECGKRFTQKPALDYHWRLHTGERPHTCMFCGRGFNSKAGKDSHERVHTGEKPYQCNKCNAGFRCSANLRQHELIHEDSRAFPCSQCDKRFRRREAMQIHMRTHTGERPYSCPICSRNFTQKGDMKKHTHSHRSKSHINCPDCSQTFTNGKLHVCESRFIDKIQNLQTVSPKTDNIVTFPEITIVTSDIQECEVEYQS